jgi:hypothetical protein
VATVSDQVGDIFRHSYTTQAAATTKAKATKGVLSVIDIRLTDGEGGQDSDSSAKHAVWHARRFGTSSFERGEVELPDITNW